MKIDRLFQILVVTGAASVAGGLVGCGDDTPAPGPGGTGGAAAGTGGASGADCNTICGPSQNAPSGTDWTDCDGCCCWLAPDTPAPAAGLSPGCPASQTCCAGRGR
jgi:hypothetical protein